MKDTCSYNNSIVYYYICFNNLYFFANFANISIYLFLCIIFQVDFVHGFVLAPTSLHG